MTLTELRERIKLELTGGLLELEIEDAIIDKIITNELLEIQKYIDTPITVTCPFAKCIDMKGLTKKCSAVTKVYRVEGYTGDANMNPGDVSSGIDPMYAQMWMTFCGGGSMYNLQDYMLNYMSYNTLLQIRNTISTDMAFRYDKVDEKLYINTSFDKPVRITIEYIPVIEKIEDLASDYWQDMLYRISMAMTKVILGRIRTKYKGAGQAWAIDGEQLLQEGNTELTAIRETLQANNNLILPND